MVGGDLTDVDTLGPALADVEAVHLITFGGDDGADLTNGPELAAALEAAGVSRVSVLGGWTATSVEPALAASGIATGVVQPAEFMGNALEWAEEIVARGTVSMLATYPSVVVHEADIAAVAAAVLTEDGHGGRAYPVTGPEALTPQERTRILAEATGLDLRFVALTPDQERERLRGFGYEEDYVEFGVQLGSSTPEGSGTVLTTIADVTGRPARTFAQWAREHAHRFRG